MASVDFTSKPFDSSSSLAKAKRLEDIDVSGSLAQEGGRSDKTRSNSACDLVGRSPTSTKNVFRGGRAPPN